MDIKQLPDGSVGFYSDQEGKLLSRVGGPSTPIGGTSATAKYRTPITAVVPLALMATGAVFTAAVANIQLDPNDDVIIDNVQVYISASTPACSLDIGTASAAAVTNNNLINGLTTTGLGIFDTQTNKGVLGKTSVYLAAGGWVSVTPSSTPTSLAGNLYVTYHKA